MAAGDASVLRSINEGPRHYSYEQAWRPYSLRANLKKEPAMSKFVVATFPSESKAYEGVRAFQDLHGEGAISLYSFAVVARDTSGKLAVRQEADEGPVGTVMSAFVGGLVGLIGGPVGSALGMSMGGLIGSMGDLINLGVTADFMREVADAIEPGKVAVIAEMEEEWQTPLDTRVAGLGGTVIRQSRAYVEDAIIEKDIEATRAELEQLRTEAEKAGAAAKTNTKAALNRAETKLRALSKQASERIERLKGETEAKTKSLQRQAKEARAESQARIDRQIKDVQADFKARSQKLGAAWELTKEALA
jgi:uncharacterized membrane protein